MRVNIRLFGALRDRLPAEQHGKTVLNLPQEATVQDALDALGIDHLVVVSVNDAQESDTQSILSEGDNLLVFEVAAGG